MAAVRTIVASRSLGEEGQEQFAQLSGDRNPIHMDRVAARRTQAGQRVVHGVHQLLWALESLIHEGWVVKPFSRVKVKFLRWTYLDDLAELSLPAEAGLHPGSFEVEVRGVTVLSADLEYGEQAILAGSPGEPACATQAPLSSPRKLCFADMAQQSGCAYVAPATAGRAAFPRLVQLHSARTVAEVAACSYIVGMEVPGLHSLFSKLDLSFASSPLQAGLSYKVIYQDERFSKVRLGVSGSTLSGTLEAFLRVPPVAQASIEQAAQVVKTDEFKAMRALIIGGSRGLGEATAKIVAAGGGEAIVSYSVGRSDAEMVVHNIQAWGGSARSLEYDVCRKPSVQLAALGAAPTHLFYFATNTIFRPKQGVLSAPLLGEFIQFYLQGFYDLCVALTELADAPARLIVLYPSTVFVEDRPAGMTEYAMVKAAGEQLCADINLYHPRLHVIVSRLPRLQTDQTAGILPDRDIDPLTALVPLVRQMLAPSPRDGLSS